MEEKDAESGMNKCYDRECKVESEGVKYRIVLNCIELYCIVVNCIELY